jgi:hypothetical protein
LTYIATAIAGEVAGVLWIAGDHVDEDGHVARERGEREEWEHDPAEDGPTSS